MRYVVRPISDRTWLRADHQRTGHQFTASWSDTLELLGRHIDYLRGTDVVIELDVEERHVRQDGMIRSDARPSSPAVVVAFESKHGPMLYRSDRYATTYGEPGWKANVRAVALTLQALRAVDRYGATETGQQYAGFKALPAGRAMPASHMTDDVAMDLLIQTVGEDADWADEAELYKKARIAAHPDRNDGDHAVWHQVEEAGRVLGVAK